MSKENSHAAQTAMYAAAMHKAGAQPSKRDGSPQASGQDT
jgi:hypothetical protein